MDEEEQREEFKRQLRVTRPNWPDATPFGDELAIAVASYLQEDQWYKDQLGAIVRFHRDYTGHGLFHEHETGKFLIARTVDGFPRESETFADETEFICWLSRQSDLTLSGFIPMSSPILEQDAGNQRITRALILEILGSKSEKPER